MKVFYMPQQSVASNKSFSPSAGKPEKVLAEWQRLGLPIEVMNFKPCTRAQLALAHSTKYVENVLSCKRPNGFGNTFPEVAASLPYTSGSFVAAAIEAVKSKTNTASLTSGFHHASYDHGGGFCTFNGLIVAAQVLRLAGVKKVGIIDLDEHYGDGTADIIEHLELDYIRHYTFGADNVRSDESVGPESSSSASAWLKKLPQIVDSFKDCDVILCQLGADPYIHDPLGGVLEMEQMRERDEIVFSVAKKLGIPVAWNLAGGYTHNFQEVLDIHTQSARACLAHK